MFIVSCGYDQNQGFDAYQNTANNQPRIVKGSELVSSGGKPALDFDGAGSGNTDHLDIIFLRNNSRFDMFAMYDTDDINFSILHDPQNGNLVATHQDGSSTTWKNSNFADADSKAYVNGVILSADTRDVLHDQGGQRKLVTFENCYTSTLGSLNIGLAAGDTSWNFSGKICELIMYPNMNPSPKRFEIESNMTRHFDLNLLANGTFDTDSDWIKGTGWSIANGIASIDGSQSTWSMLRQENILPPAGAKVEVTITVSNYSSGYLYIKAGADDPGLEITANGTYTAIRTIVGANQFRIQADPNFVGSVDNVKVQWYGTDGHVVELFDQSGNNNPARQNTAANQPLLVSGGDVLTAGGKPAIEFDGTNDYLPIASDFNDNLNLNNISSSVVYKPSNTTQQGILLFLGGSTGGNKRWYQPFIDTTTTKYSYGTNHPASSETSNLDHSVLTFIAGSNLGGFRAYRNGTAQGSGNTSLIDNSAATDQAGIGAYSQGSLHFAGKFQEAIIYDSDQNASRSGIQNNQGQHFGITIA